MQKIVYSNHALEQMDERGTNKTEVEETLLKGERIPAKRERQAYRLNFQYDNLWAGKFYAIKQVMPIVKTEANRTIIITVYVFYF